MPLSAGDKLGPYEILAPIGAGGMGEVYRARDTRLHREVATKVSAQQFSEHGLTAAKMRECRWLKPVLVGQFEFVEWTGDAHLRHAKFVGLRADSKARDVRREPGG